MAFFLLGFLAMFALSVFLKKTALLSSGWSPLKRDALIDCFNVYESRFQVNHQRYQDFARVLIKGVGLWRLDFEYFC